jgi:hypothetical protein
VEFSEVSGYSGWQAVADEFARHCSLSPWLYQWPVIVEDITFMPLEKEWIWIDNAKQIARLDKRFDKIWKVLSYGGGHPLTMCFIRENDSFLPLGLWHKERYVVL